MTQNTYYINKGEKYPINIHIKNGEEGLDISEYEVFVQIKDELKDECNTLEYTISQEASPHGQIIDPTKGEIVFNFTDEDYDVLVPSRVYMFNIWLQNTSYNKLVSGVGDNYLRLIVCP